MHYFCAACKVLACTRKDWTRDELPENCPMRDEAYMKEISEAYKAPEIAKFYADIYDCDVKGMPPVFTPKLIRTIAMMKKCGFKKIGMAFCVGFKDEADVFSRILRKNGFEVVSVCCCNGGFCISEHGIPLPDGCEFDAACNPLGQAELLNQEKTEFNLVMGLCGGHDTMFVDHSNALCTTLWVKDPATGHSPASALYLYNSYYGRFFEPVPTPWDLPEKEAN